MHWTIVGRMLGVVWVSLAGLTLAPLTLALVRSEPWLPFAYTALLALCAGGALLRWLDGDRVLGHREAFLAVTLVWLSVCLIGAIPFGTHPTVQIPWIDALFESVSGFTTTGATVLSGLDTLPRSLLLWRSLSQWVGGMGIVVLGVAVLPLLGVGGMDLYKAEAPGPTKDKMTPRIAETARLLWMLYLGMTVAAAAAFLLYGMGPFDAVNHAMTAVATAGFSTHDQSLGYYDSSGIHVVAMLTMLAGGTSFAILHRAMTSRLSWSEEPELRAYVGIFGLATLVIAIDLWFNMAGSFPSFASAVEHSAFQAASILTTTGYSTTDFDRWPPAAHAVLLGLFLIGGMAGSTAGGPKVLRVLLLGKLAFVQFPKLLHSRSVSVLRLGTHIVDQRVLMSSLGFLAMWLVLLAGGTLALAAAGADPMTSLTAAAVSLGNIGPGFGAIGPSENFAHFDVASKLVTTTLMLLGRLEIYTVLIVLTPGFWRF